jgi:hypothetical protein
MSQKIIWQPISVYQSGYGFGILLDPEFAKDMLTSNLSSDKSKRIQDFANEQLKKSNYDYPTPYIFNGDSCLVNQFYIGDGKELGIDSLIKFESNFDKPIKYFSHNVDYSSDAYALMKLVDLWVKCSEVIKEK